MDSYFYKKLLDKIYRIIWFFDFRFPDETGNDQSASRKEFILIDML
jgi:hypothetical protein